MRLPVRPRRLRSTAAVRRLVTDVRPHPSDLVLPVFVREGLEEPQPIRTLPGVVQHSRASLVAAAKEATAAGLHGFAAGTYPVLKKVPATTFAKGLSTAEIAQLRRTSEGTVKAQTAAIYRKAGVTGRPQLLSLFIEDLMEGPLDRSRQSRA